MNKQKVLKFGILIWLVALPTFAVRIEKKDDGAGYGPQKVSRCPKALLHLWQSLQWGTKAKKPEAEMEPSPQPAREADGHSFSKFADFAATFTPQENARIEKLGLKNGVILTGIFDRICVRDAVDFRSLVFDPQNEEKLKTELLRDHALRVLLIKQKHPWAKP